MVTKRLIPWAVVFLPLTAPHHSFATPWVDAGDERTRHHLLVLNDSGKLKLPLSSWPMMWSGIKSGLDNLKAEDLNETELWSYRYLRHALKQAMRTNEINVSVHGASHPGAFGDFSTDSNEQAEAVTGATFTSEQLALNLQKSFLYDPIDGYKYRYDGSYLASTLGNWVFGIGAQNRWWGPGWQNSMILSHNGRPVPSIFVQRKDTAAHSGDWTRSVAWDITLFSGMLEKKRFIERPWFSGARLTVKPWRFLELGISGTQIWGGEAPKQEESDPPLKKESYRLCSFDWRLGHNFGGLQMGLYQQKTCTRQSPQLHANTYGLEVAAMLGGTNSRIALEFNDNSNNGNSFYDHHYYQNGYRQHERALGSSFDTAASAVTLLAEHYLSNGHQIGWRLGKVKLNDDNTQPDTGANFYSSDYVEVSFYRANYKLPVTDWLQVEAGATHYNKDIALRNKTISSGGYVQFNISF
ncbi:capsule assembly protein Wzi [Alteromonadaceae bacterium 2753L.S.0a.02]|nr:capsule assembly protein Wzi [Alteromonadaceae bacterium 2753L.S.0a.02]